MKDNLKAKVKNAFIWDFFGKLSINTSGFIISIFLARLLEPSDFGLVGIPIAIIGIAWTFYDMGLSGTLIQKKRVLPIHYSSVFFINIFMGLFLTIVTYLLSNSIASFYNDDRLVLIIKVISIYFILSAFPLIYIVILKRELRFKELAKISFISSIIGGVVGVLLAYNNFGVWSLISQQLLTAIINGIFFYKISKYKVEFKFSIKALLYLWKFGFRIFLSSIIDNIFKRIDLMIIAKLFTPTTLGFFQRAKSLDTMIITYSSGTILSVLMPVLSKIKNNLPVFQSVIVKALGLVTFVSFFLSGLFFLISKELIVVLFGDKWLISVGFFQILVLVSFISPISSLLSIILISRGKSKIFLKLEIYKKIILSMNLFIVFIWGIYGYLYGFVIASILSLYLTTYFASIEIKLSKQVLFKPIIIELIITFISTFSIYILNLDSSLSDVLILIIKSAEFLILYVFLNHIFKVTSYQFFINEVNQMYNKLRKNKN